MRRGHAGFAAMIVGRSGERTDAIPAVVPCPATFVPSLGLTAGSNSGGRARDVSSYPADHQ